MNNPITLTTDFGVKDPWQGAMKGVILSINPTAKIVDISHSISPRNVLEGAFILSEAYRFFPDGTVHVAVVDPGVGGERAPVLIATEKFSFVGPDNGIFTFALEREKVRSVVKLTREEYFLKEVSGTFHGRDVFAPVAAHVSMGVPSEKFGEPLSTPPVTIDLPRPVEEKGSLLGEVLYVDAFGNLITNIGSDDIARFKGGEGGGGGGRLEVTVKGRTIKGLVKSYSGAVEGDLVALMGSTGKLEIACFMGSASRLLGCGEGEGVELR
ncbi:MAG: SAM-dependent chlorinase/fluorinase [Thermodesulfobacteriota bacterium]